MVRRWILALLLAAGICRAAGPVYVVLWFDTEDYIEPAADDAALRIASDLTKLGIRATFKVVGEKARVLERRDRTDVIRALALHDIGYHTDFHSVPPAPAVYLRDLGFVAGAAEFERRERDGIASVTRIFGVVPSCYGQPGSSWGPQANPALRRMGVPVYLDEGQQVGLDEQPFWYDGLLYVFNMGRFSMRAELNGAEPPARAFEQFDRAAAELASRGGGLISIYYHPTEFVTTEFWDAVNFSHGANTERSQWRRPHRRTEADSERCYNILHDYAAHIRAVPGVRFVTARELRQLCGSPIPPRVDRSRVAKHLAAQQTFLRTESGDLSAADVLLALLGMEPEIVDGPETRLSSTVTGPDIPRPAFERARNDAVSFIRANKRLPAAVWIASQRLSIGDFAATLATDDGDGPVVRVRKAKLEFERYIASDPEKPFNWVIHPAGFRAPELLELARLQGWTLKPAHIR